MKNNLFAVVAVSFLVLAGCAEKNFSEDRDNASESVTFASAELDELQRERRDRF